MWAFPLRAADQAERGEREVESGSLLPSPLPFSWGIERAEITLSPALGEGKEGAEIVLPLQARRERERAEIILPYLLARRKRGRGRERERESGRKLPGPPSPLLARRVKGRGAPRRGVKERGNSPETPNVWGLSSFHPNVSKQPPPPECLGVLSSFHPEASIAQSWQRRGRHGSS